MPMDATPNEQLVVAVATKCAGDPTVLLLAGDVTYTPAAWVPPTTLIFTVEVVEPPQLSHSWTTTLYVPGLKLRLVLRLAPPTV